MHRLRSLWTLWIAMLALAGCGGGEGGGTPPPQSTKAIVTLSTAGTLADGAKIGSIDIIVNLPEGVTVKATPDSVTPSILIADSGVVVTSGFTLPLPLPSREGKMLDTPQLAAGRFIEFTRVGVARHSRPDCLRGRRRRCRRVDYVGDADVCNPWVRPRYYRLGKIGILRKREPHGQTVDAGGYVYVTGYTAG